MEFDLVIPVGPKDEELVKKIYYVIKRELLDIEIFI